MPILAGLLSSTFGVVASFLAARMSIGLAAAAAYLLTAGVAFAAVKVALAALSSGLTAVLGPTTYLLLSYAMPGNIGACITAILIGDATITAWDYWRQTLGIAVQLAKA